jgi:ribosome biogenesis protein ENP2
VSKIAGDLATSLLYAVGTTNGTVSIFDLRYPKVINSIKHQYYEAINGIKYHSKSRNILTSTKKLVKINNLDTGKLFTNIEPKEEINGLELVKDSGLIFIANESIRIGTYFIPALDSAPKWCHYIENITEELEEELTTKVYDEYKFLSMEDVEKLQAGSLIGSKLVKPYMHGFLMHYKLFQKLEAAADPFAFEKYRKERVTKRLEEKMANRISLKGAGGVNSEFRTMLKKKSAKNWKDGGAEFDTELGEKGRFEAIFKDPRFKIDVQSEEFMRNNPSGMTGEGVDGERIEPRKKNKMIKKIKKNKKKI